MKISSQKIKADSKTKKKDNWDIVQINPSASPIDFIKENDGALKYFLGIGYKAK